MVRAPREEEDAIAPKPTIPTPMTETVSEGSTRPRAAAWNPTGKGSTTLSSRKDNPAEFTSFCQGMVKKFFMAPSRCTPNVSLNLQAFILPRKQDAQRP